MIAWPKDTLILVLAFVLSLIVTRIMVFINIQDIPGKRSSHTHVTPRAGGIGLLVGFYISLFMQGFSHLPFYEDWISQIILLCCAAVMGLIGFYDDLKGSSPIFRLLVQIGAAWFLVRCLGSFQAITLPSIGDISLGPLALLVSILWIVGFTNVFNFMDGLNGMAGVTTVIASLFLAILSTLYHSDGQIHLILACATLGFLVFNFPKAKIFLGDAGSLFLGFFFASWSLLALRPAYGRFSIWVVPLLFFIFLYDAIFTRIRRLFAGKGFLEAHREHIYQLLNRSGWNHVKVTFLYALIFILQGLTSLFMIAKPQEDHLLFFIPFLIGAIPFTWWVLKKARKAGVSF